MRRRKSRRRRWRMSKMIEQEEEEHKDAKACLVTLPRVSKQTQEGVRRTGGLVPGACSATSIKNKIP